ncbi:MAG: response regulator transcription factor [Comamonadaceae bacterium]|nr:MAG: response regulator transcription factor [Comamonadaceae bacterium]
MVTPAAIRVGIVDDHAIVRTALRQWLQDHADLYVVGEAGNGFEALELVARTPPDVLILDLGLPGRSGLDIIASLLAKAPDLAVLVFTGSPEAQYARQLLREGARGYLHKSCSPDELVTAIRRVAGGHRHFSDALAQDLAMAHASGAGSPLDGLSKREFQVLLLLAEGAKPAAISEKLHLSARTVTLYRSRLVRKLSLSTNSDLTYFALKHGLRD